MSILKDIQIMGEPTRSVETLERRSLKATEELGELAEAILSVTSQSGAKKKTWMDIVEEAVDVATMGIDIALTKPPGDEYTDDEWRSLVKQMFAIKLAKWQKQLDEERTLIPAKILTKTSE